MCAFNKEPTAAILAFEGILLVATMAGLVIGRRSDPRILTRFLTIAVGVLIFEVFTAPMWHNHHLGAWAYVYDDVSWILTVGWAGLILSAIVLVDRNLPSLRPGKRFGAYLALLTGVVLVAEALVVNLGIRSYSQEVEETVIGLYVAGVPIEALYYIPVFLALVVGFYKYWALVIDDELLVPVLKKRWGRTLGLTAIAVVLFELMVEPMVVNSGLPSWSYFYRDISFLLTGMWIVLITAGTVVIDRYFLSVDLKLRFIGYLAVIGLLALPIESWLVQQGIREYGPTASAAFTGFTTPITGVPVEVAFAIPLYMALIVGFTRYWEIVSENRQGMP